MQTNLDVELQNTNPHYTKKHFRQAQTIWGEESKDLDYAHSDCILQWDYNKAQEAQEVATQKAKPKTARWYQEYLAAYFDKPVELRHILAGVDPGNGLSYRIYGYKFI